MKPAGSRIAPKADANSISTYIPIDDRKVPRAKRRHPDATLLTCDSSCRQLDADFVTRIS
jgi:hypothetical protein